MTTIRTYDAADHAALVDHFARAGDGSPTGKLRCPTRTSCVRAVAHALHRTINS